MIEVLPYGPSAVLINFRQDIDVDIVAQVYEVQKVIEPIRGVKFTIPAFCSLLVGIDENITNLHEIQTAISQYDLTNQKIKLIKSQIIEIPVCYDTVFGIDLEYISQSLNISISEIIRLHSSVVYTVYMMGFLPGFPYLGRINKALELPRKTSPRSLITRGSVGIAASQTGIYPQDSPGGWHIIGKTPINMVDHNGHILLNPLDRVKFEPISTEEYYQLEGKI